MDGDIILGAFYEQDVVAGNFFEAAASFDKKMVWRSALLLLQRVFGAVGRLQETMGFKR